MGADLRRVERALRDAVVTDDPFLTEVASHLILAGRQTTASRARDRRCCRDVTRRGRGVSRCDHGSDGGRARALGIALPRRRDRRGADPSHGRERQRAMGQPQGDPRGRLPVGEGVRDRREPRAPRWPRCSRRRSAGCARARSASCSRRSRSTAPRPTTTRRSRARRQRSSRQRPASAPSSPGTIVPLIDAATTYGLQLGTAFQIVDDILDLTATEAELGKPTGPRPLRRRVHAARAADPVARHGGERRAARPARSPGRGHRAREGARHRAVERRHPGRVALLPGPRSTPP